MPKLLKRRGALVTDHPDSVAITWALSFDKIERMSPAAAELLRFCAFLHPDAIPEEIITDGASELGPVLQSVAGDPFELNIAIAEILKYSLLRRDPIAKTLDIHRLVQAVLKEGIDESVQLQWATRTVRAVNRAFPEYELSKLPRCERLLPHAQICAELIKQWGIESREAAQLLGLAGGYLYDRARFNEAEPLYRQTLSIEEQLLGPEHPEVASTINNLAVLLYDQARYSEAEPALHKKCPLTMLFMGKIELFGLEKLSE